MPDEPIDLEAYRRKRQEATYTVAAGAFTVKTEYLTIEGNTFYEASLWLHRLLRSNVQIVCDKIVLRRRIPHGDLVIPAEDFSPPPKPKVVHRTDAPRSSFWSWVRRLFRRNLKPVR